MLANLMPPPSPVRVTALEIVTAPGAKTKSFVVVHPRYRAWLAKCGLVRPEAFLELPGEIVSGHQDRHVMRVELPSDAQPRVVYLKREHRVGWRVRLRNWRGGFGFVSRSEREACVLKHLDAKALPGPQWIAYGEDSHGRAFLMVDDLAGSLDLRLEAKAERRAEYRSDSCRRVGQAIAELHASGVSTPDLCAKHVFLRRDSGSVTILDWPSATLHDPITFDMRAHAMAQLHASLAESLVSSRERLRCLRAYCRRQWGQPPMREWITKIQQLQPRLAKSSSIRDQQCDTEVMAQQRLVWLAEDEAVCVTPKLAKSWPVPAMGAPYYSMMPAGSTTILASDGKPATLQRFRTFAPLGRMLAGLRGESWRSPAVKLARQIFYKQREGRAAPELLAFGQRMTSAFTAESFVLLRKGDELC